MVKNAMLKFAIAGAVVVFGLAATAAPVIAAPRDTDCVDCPVSQRYDSEEVVQKIRSLDHSLPNEAPIDVRVNSRVHDAKRASETKRASRLRNDDCADCPQPRKYNDREVVKKVRNIDRSRVINTTTVVPAGRRMRETNRLVVHQNETRYSGVVHHNHTIVEKEIRYVRRVPITTTVEFVTHNYRVVERPDAVSIPVTLRRAKECYRGRSYGRNSCGPLRVRG